ncbi:hypothetical protein D3C71_2109720 [compost metagenome]
MLCDDLLVPTVRRLRKDVGRSRKGERHHLRAVLPNVLLARRDFGDGGRRQRSGTKQDGGRCRDFSG